MTTTVPQDPKKALEVALGTEIDVSDMKVRKVTKKRRRGVRWRNMWRDRRDLPEIVEWYDPATDTCHVEDDTAGAPLWMLTERYVRQHSPLTDLERALDEQIVALERGRQSEIDAKTIERYAVAKAVAGDAIAFVMSRADPSLVHETRDHWLHRMDNRGPISELGKNDLRNHYTSDVAVANINGAPTVQEAVKQAKELRRPRQFVRVDGNWRNPIDPYHSGQDPGYTKAVVDLLQAKDAAVPLADHVEHVLGNLPQDSADFFARVKNVASGKASDPVTGVIDRSLLSAHRLGHARNLYNLGTRPEDAPEAYRVLSDHIAAYPMDTDARWQLTLWWLNDRHLSEPAFVGVDSFVTPGTFYQPPNYEDKKETLRHERHLIGHSGEQPLLTGVALLPEFYWAYSVEDRAAYAIRAFDTLVDLGEFTAAASIYTSQIDIIDRFRRGRFSQQVGRALQGKAKAIAEEALIDARGAFADSDYDTCLHLAQRALDFAHFKPHANLWIARAYNQQGRFGAALEQLEVYSWDHERRDVSRDTLLWIDVEEAHSNFGLARSLVREGPTDSYSFARSLSNARTCANDVYRTVTKDQKKKKPDLKNGEKAKKSASGLLKKINAFEGRAFDPTKVLAEITGDDTARSIRIRKNKFLSRLFARARKTNIVNGVFYALSTNPTEYERREIVYDDVANVIYMNHVPRNAGEWIHTRDHSRVLEWVVDSYVAQHATGVTAATDALRKEYDAKAVTEPTFATAVISNVQAGSVKDFLLYGLNCALQSVPNEAVAKKKETMATVQVTDENVVGFRKWIVARAKDFYNEEWAENYTFGELLGMRVSSYSNSISPVHAYVDRALAASTDIGATVRELLGTPLASVDALEDAVRPYTVKAKKKPAAPPKPAARPAVADEATYRSLITILDDTGMTSTARDQRLRGALHSVLTRRGGVSSLTLLADRFVADGRVDDAMYCMTTANHMITTRSKPCAPIYRTLHNLIHLKGQIAGFGSQQAYDDHMGLALYYQALAENLEAK